MRSLQDVERKVYMTQKEEEYRPRSKREVLLQLLDSSLPPEADAAIDTMVFDLWALAQKAGMQKGEFHSFVREQQGLLEQKSKAKKNRTPAMYSFVKGYKTVQDVRESISVSTQKFKNHVVYATPMSKSRMDKSLGRK